MPKTSPIFGVHTVLDIFNKKKYNANLGIHVHLRFTAEDPVSSKVQEGLQQLTIWDTAKIDEDGL
jgi:hypothetical protein